MPFDEGDHLLLLKTLVAGEISEMSVRFQLIPRTDVHKKRRSAWRLSCLACAYDSADRVTQRKLSFNAIGGSGTSTPEITTCTWDNASRLSAQATWP
jgi:hypothetical protein